MYRKWKTVGEFRGPGRPATMSVDEITIKTNSALMDKLHDSNTFKLKQMKELIVSKAKAKTRVWILIPSNARCHPGGQK